MAEELDFRLDKDKLQIYILLLFEQKLTLLGNESRLFSSLESSFIPVRRNNKMRCNCHYVTQVLRQCQRTRYSLGNRSKFSRFVATDADISMCPEILTMLCVTYTKHF